MQRVKSWSFHKSFNYHTPGMSPLNAPRGRLYFTFRFHWLSISIHLTWVPTWAELFLSNFKSTSGFELSRLHLKCAIGNYNTATIQYIHVHQTVSFNIKLLCWHTYAISYYYARIRCITYEIRHKYAFFLRGYYTRMYYTTIALHVRDNMEKLHYLERNCDILIRTGV